MEDLSLPFNFRIAELLPIARLLRASYQRDQADFQDLLPADYKPQFLAGYDTALHAVEQAVRSNVSIAQRQLITARITVLLGGLPQLLNRLEARLRRATSLTVGAKQFGIEPVRRDRNNHEYEGLIDSLRTLLQNIESNKTTLLDKGQTQVEIDQIQELYNDLVQDRTAQGRSLGNQRLLTTGNVRLFRALYSPMKQLLDDGKSLYKTINETKLKDYTLNAILKQVRRERPTDTLPPQTPLAA